MIINIVNKIISSQKGTEYLIDKSIPLSVLLNIIFERICMAFRGKLSFVSHQGMFYLGSKVILKCKSKLNLESGVTISRGCYIDALSKNGIRLSKNVSLGKYIVVECTGNIQHLGKGLIIHENVGIGHNSFLGCAGGIEISRDTIIGNFVSFHSENHNYENITVPIRLQGVNHQGIFIGENCWIGAKVTILDGVTLGNNCIVAAGAVLKSGFYEPNCIYGGVPAKLIKKR